MPDAWMKGIYPNMKDSILGKREDYLRMRLKEASESYSEILPELSDPDKLAKYLEKLDPKVRELFLEVDRFVAILYNERESIPDFLQDALVIVLVFSIVETLQTKRREYVKLSDWLQTQECAKEFEKLSGKDLSTRDRLKILAKTYFRQFGTTQAAFEYFNANLTNDHKKSLIRSYQTEKECIEGVSEALLKHMMPKFDETMTIQMVKEALKERVEVRRAFLPLCYGVTCYVDRGECCPDVGCRLDRQELMRETLRKVVSRLLYAYRNAFVHKASLPVLASEKPEDVQMFSFTVYTILDKKLVAHELARRSLLDAFAISLREFFSNHKDTNVQS